MADARGTWWVAGGWALDLWLGRATRAHADVDVGCFRGDLESIRAALDGWQLHGAHDGVLRRLDAGEQPAQSEHALWCRPRGVRCWMLEILLEERSAREWVFRRNGFIRLPIERLMLETGDGIPFLRPEVQLLYKAKGARAKDDADLDSVLPTLEPSARAWLRAALVRAHPGHPWIARME